MKNKRRTSLFIRANNNRRIILLIKKSNEELDPMLKKILFLEYLA